jgi:hypothetical protein
VEKMSKELIVSGGTRDFIIVTGCLTSLAGVALGLALGLALPASISIVGAIVQPKFHRLGRGLICAGAILLSFCVFGLGFLLLSEMLHAFDRIRITEIVEAFSAVLVAVCDAAIIKEEIRIRRAERGVTRALKNASA